MGSRIWIRRNDNSVKRSATGGGGGGGGDRRNKTEDSHKGDAGGAEGREKPDTEKLCNGDIEDMVLCVVGFTLLRPLPLHI